MKLWMRFYIIAFTLIVLALGLCTYLVLTQSLRQELDREVQRGMDNHYMVINALGASTTVSEAAGIEEARHDEAIRSACANYARYFVINKDDANKDVYLAVYPKDGTTPLYNSAPFLPLDQLEAPTDSSRRWVIRRVEHSDMLVVGGDTTLFGQTYLVYYVQDISRIINSGAELAQNIALVDMAVLTLLGIALFVSVRLAVRPLKSLQKATRAISGGTYDQRIPVQTKSDDEISELARDFNHMSQAVEEHISQLKATADDRRMLIANMTHELKTPMTSIIGYSEILLRARLDPKQQESALTHIHNESLRIEALSQKLMRLVALEGENLDVREESVQELLEGVQTAVEMLLKQHGQSLTLHNELDTLPIDRDLMTGLLTNLIDNARKASPQGSVIELSAFCSPEGWPVLQVKDNGHGIPADELPKIMEPFYMVDKQRSRRNNSAGLGLSLCAIIAQVHHARIRILSTVDVGTSVQVIFGGEDATPKPKKHLRTPRRGRTAVQQRARQIGRGRPIGS